MFRGEIYQFPWLWYKNEVKLKFARGIYNGPSVLFYPPFSQPREGAEEMQIAKTLIKFFYLGARASPYRFIGLFCLQRRHSEKVREPFLCAARATCGKYASLWPALSLHTYTTYSPRNSGEISQNVANLSTPLTYTSPFYFPCGRAVISPVLLRYAIPRGDSLYWAPKVLFRDERASYWARIYIWCVPRACLPYCVSHASSRVAEIKQGFDLLLYIVLLLLLLCSKGDNQKTRLARCYIGLSTRAE